MGSKRNTKKTFIDKKFDVYFRPLRRKVMPQTWHAVGETAKDNEVTDGGGLAGRCCATYRKDLD
jgi:hypothetical protein